MTLRITHAAIAAGLMMSISGGAHAQVGGLINRARKAAQSETPAGSNAAIGDPFDAASLNAALKGMKTLKTRAAELEAVRADYIANQTKRDAIEEANKRQIDEYNVNHDRIGTCVGTYLQSLEPAHQQQMQQSVLSRTSDAAAMQKFQGEMVRISTALSQAAMKHDTVAMAKAQAEQYKLLGVDIAADSAAAAKRCGTLPARPAALAQMDALSARSDSLASKQRMAESTAEIDAARDAGVTPARFAQMRERLTTFRDKPSAFPGAEGELLKAHKAQIDDALKTS